MPVIFHQTLTVVTVMDLSSQWKNFDVFTEIHYTFLFFIVPRLLQILKHVDDRFTFVNHRAEVR